MAKFNLKNIIMKEYGVDHLEASNFSDFVYKTLKLNVVLGDDYKEKLVSDSSSNKKDFIKSLVNRMSKFRDITPHSYKRILDDMDTADEKPNPAYEELRKVKLELEEVKSKNVDLTKRLQEVSSKGFEDIANLSVNLEVTTKLVNEFNHYISEFPGLSEAFKKVRVAHGRASFNKRARLKQLLIDADMSEIAADQLLNDYSKQTIDIFNQERCEDIDFDSSENVIRASRDLFKFVMNNKDFVEACMILKECKDVVPMINTTDKNPDPKYHLNMADKEETFVTPVIETNMICLTTEFLAGLDRVFVSSLDRDGVPKMNRFATAAVSIFGNNIKHEICDTIGVDFEVYNRNTYIKREDLPKLIEKFNSYAISCLKGVRS